VEIIQGDNMRTIRIVALIVVWSTFTFAQSERSLIRDGNRLYKDNKFTDAEVNYKKALEKNKESSHGVFNLGDALYKQGRFDEAAQQYQNIASTGGDSELKSKAYHNLGNALLRNQKIPESISAYKEALKLNPGDIDTKYNLEFAKTLLKQQQQQKQQNKDQKKDDKQKQDQQKQDQQKNEEQKQSQQDQKKQEQQQAQQKKQQISKEDAERILEALKNEEKDVQKKLHKRVPARVRVEKDW
jgi:Ca-activated chloride channel homolog